MVQRTQAIAARAIWRPSPSDTSAPSFTPAVSSAQRIRGDGRLSARLVDGRTRVSALFQEGAAQIRCPRRSDDGELEAVLINTGGGLTGGDRIAWTLSAEAGARLTATTQACEKIYRATAAEPALAVVQLRADARARLDWLPQETILYDRARLGRTLEADVAADAELLLVEAVILGRTAMGETVETGLFRDRWRVRRAGRLLHAEDLAVEGPVAAVGARPACLGGAGAFASLLLVAPDAEARLPALRAALGDHGGASAFGGRLAARLTAQDGQTLRRILIPALAALRDGAPLPRVWSC